MLSASVKLVSIGATTCSALVERAFLAHSSLLEFSIIDRRIHPLYPVNGKQRVSGSDKLRVV